MDANTTAKDHGRRKGVGHQEIAEDTTSSLLVGTL